MDDPQTYILDPLFSCSDILAGKKKKNFRNQQEGAPFIYISNSHFQMLEIEEIDKHIEEIEKEKEEEAEKKKQKK